MLFALSQVQLRWVRAGKPHELEGDLTWIEVNWTDMHLAGPRLWLNNVGKRGFIDMSVKPPARKPQCKLIAAVLLAWIDAVAMTCNAINFSASLKFRDFFEQLLDEIGLKTFLKHLPRHD
jgi:hypothetical protein